MAAAATGASAQGTDGPLVGGDPGFGRPESQPRRAHRTTTRAGAPEAIDDLRPDATPLRSELMIEALGGGHPALSAHRRQRRLADDPGTRMIRPEDDDERMPAAAPAADDQRRAVGARRSERISGSGTRTSEPAVRRFQLNQWAAVTRTASTSRRCRR